MQVKDILREASYPGNVGAMEVFKFYQAATPDEKQYFEDMLKRDNIEAAWELVQNVTGVRLHPASGIKAQR